MKRRRAILLALVVSAAVLAVVPLADAGMLDQSQPGLRPDIAADVLDKAAPKAQTFTSGLTGDLDQVDFAVSRTLPGVSVSLKVEIRPLSNGVPSSTTLASAGLPATSVPVGFVPRGFLSVPLNPPAPVVAGVRYAIVLWSSPSCGFNCYMWGLGPLGDPYPSGSAFQSFNGGATWTPFSLAGSADLTFKTYVEPRPTSKQQCKKGGWRQFRNPSFKNQGQCVKFVNHHGGKAKGDGKGTENGKKKGHGKKK